MNLKEQLAALLKSMRAIVDGAKAENRDLNDAEMTDLEAKSDEAQELKAKITRQEKGDELLKRVAAAEGKAAPGNEAKSASWAERALAGLREVTKGVGIDGQKSLTLTTISAPALLSPVTIDALPRTVLDLIPVSNAASIKRDGNGFSFVRQDLRTNNAGAVPDFGAKPESNYGFGQVDDTFRTYANKTEGMPWRWLDDFSTIIDVVRQQLGEDTLAAIERDVISGDGEDDRFLGLLETSGLRTQAFTTDLITTLSNAKYALIGAERTITGWALNPADLKALELLRENGATGGFLFKSRTEIEAFLDAPVVTSNGIPAGTALGGNWSQAELLPLGDDELVLDPQKRTVNNTFLLMFEGRYGFRVKKPSDFIKVTLAA